MRELIDNKFLERYNFNRHNLTINNFLYGERVPEHKMDHHTCQIGIRAMLLYIGFKSYYLGTIYLTRLLELYLICDDFDLRDALNFIADERDITLDSILTNISDAFLSTPKILRTVSYLFEMPISYDDVVTISDLLAMLGALYKIYYNTSVDKPDFTHEKFTNIDRMIDYGKQDGDN